MAQPRNKIWRWELKEADNPDNPGLTQELAGILMAMFGEVSSSLEMQGHIVEMTH